MARLVHTGGMPRRNGSFRAHVIVRDYLPFQKHVARGLAIFANNDFCAARNFVHAIGTHQLPGSLYPARIGADIPLEASIIGWASKTPEGNGKGAIRSSCRLPQNERDLPRLD